MKFTASLIICGILSYALGMFFPWWTVGIAGLLTGYFIPQKRIFAFISSFLGVFLLWSVMAYFISIANDHILAHRVSLLVLKKDNPISLILITGALGGIVAGISAFTGRSLLIAFKRN